MSCPRQVGLLLVGPCEDQAFGDDQQFDTNASDESQQAAWSRSLAVALEIAAWWLR
jgi:hypothetical protein